MATREQLETALRNADAAGDAQAARQLANALKAGQFDQGSTGNIQQPAQQQDSFLKNVADVGLEGMSSVNRGAAQIADFLTTDQVNAVLELSGSDRRVGSIEELLSPATRGGAMEPGLGRDIVQAAGEVVPAAATGGGLLRSAAAKAPALTGSSGTGAGVLKQLGATTAAGDVGFGAASGAGRAVGEEVGGPTGGLIGSVAAPLAAAGLAQGVRSAIGGAADDVLPRGAMRTADDVLASRTTSPAQQAQKATGVQLLEAQQTLNPAMLRAQRFLPELPQASQIAAKQLGVQNKQASAAVDDFIAAIAPDDAISRSGGQFRSASQRAIKAAQDSREELASPIYKQAFKDGADVNIAPVRQRIATLLDEYPTSGEVAKSATKVGRLIEGQPNLRKLHNAKVEIDTMLEKSVGDSALGRTTKRELMDLKSTLLKQMDDASDGYRQARATFEAASPRVNQLESSVIGKIADMDDTQLKNISRRIFDPAETNKTVVKNAKQVIDNVDSDAWDLLLRSEIERRIGSIKPEVGVSFENIPSKLKNAIFGTGKNREALLSGMSKTQRKNAELLETALTRAGLGRPGGSETAGRQEFIKDLDRGIVSTIRNFVRNPVDRAISVGETGAFDKRAKALADALFDPAYSAEAAKALKDPTGQNLGFLLYQVMDLGDSQPNQQEQEQQLIQAQQSPL